MEREIVEVPKVISVLDLCGIAEDDEDRLIYERRERQKYEKDSTDWRRSW